MLAGRVLCSRCRGLLAVLLAIAGVLCTASAHAQTMAVGNMVFIDANGDGHYNDLEGVANVTVQLWQVTGDDENPFVLVASQLTQSNGKYLFDNLSSGTYFLMIPTTEFEAGHPLAGLFSLPDTPSFQGDDDAGEKGQDTFDLSVTGAFTSEFLVAPGFGATDATGETGFEGASDNADDANTDLTFDFGFFRPLGVGNLVFADTNHNGIADPGEGVEGVTVQLFRAGDDPNTVPSLADVLTDPDGHFMFGALTEGSYKLRIPPSDFGPGGPLQGAMSMVGTGQAGDDDNATGPGASGDDGLDSADPAATGIVTASFSLSAGAEPVNGTTETGSDFTSDDAADDDTNLTVDFGFDFPATKVGVGNLVFLDFDGNGKADDGEGLAEVRVELYAEGQIPGVDAPLAFQVTQPDGRFLFGNLDEGNYFLHVPKSQFAAGAWLFSALSVAGTAGGDDNVGEDGVDVPYPEDTGVSTAVFTLTAGAMPTAAGTETGYGADADNTQDPNIDLTHDFGFVLRASTPLSIGNLVFRDVNLNGRFDAGDSGISGVKVELYHFDGAPGSDAPIRSVTTAANGTYLFDDLPPGRYIVHVPASEFQGGKPLEGLLSATGNGGDDSVDDNSDENGMDSPTPAFTGVSSVIIELADNAEPGETGAFPNMDLDDNNGDLTVDFGFAVDCPVLTISPGSLLPAERDQTYVQTFTLVGGSDPVWSVSSGSLPPGLTLHSATGVLDGTPTSAGSYLFTVTATLANQCSAAQAYSVEVVPPANLGIGNVVYIDANGNGAYDLGEGVPNVTLFLFHEGDNPATASPVSVVQSVADGVYGFDGLLPGNYFVHLPAGNFQAGGPLFHTVSAPGVSPDNGIDDDVAGNENGIDAVDAATTGVSSVTITLAEGTEPVDALTETGFAASTETGPDANVDNTIDFAFIAAPEVSMMLGNLVFKDSNNNQVFDSGEGVDGVIVQLFNSSDNVSSSPPLRATVTANGGRYLFSGLPEGSYKVFVPASQFLHGQPLYGCLSLLGAGSGNADDNADENGVDAPVPASTGIVSTAVSLTLGTAPTVGNGETGVDAAFDDANDANGNLTLDLGFALDCSIMTISPDTLPDAVTGSGYSASMFVSGGHAPYQWSVGFGALPPGLDLNPFTGELSGTPASYGSFSFAIQVIDDYGCFALRGYSLNVVSPPLAVGNLVFFDKNGNGHADAGEGVNGVTVQIFTSSQTPGVDAPVSSTVTSGGGLWLIDNLAPGSYRLHVPASMFASGAPLWQMKSVPGELPVGDDDAGEDGVDVVDPATSGVSSGVFVLVPLGMPVDLSESGISGASDDLRDSMIDLTRDFGFVDATSLPPTFAQWLASHAGAGSLPTGNTDGDAWNNLLEYAFGGDPAGGSNPVSAFAAVENTATGEMNVVIRRRHGGQSDLTYTVQVLAGLQQSPGSWQATSLTPAIVNNGDGTETLTFGPFETDAALAGSLTGFVRVLVALDADHNGTPEATALSQILGWQHRALALQHQTYGLSFVRPAVFTGTVDSVIGDTLSVANSAGSTDLQTLLTSGLSYYVEVISGDEEGQRWEVDETTLSGSSIPLLPADSLSTKSVTPVDLAGDMIALRPHWRMVDLFPIGDFHPTTSSALADQVLVWNPATSGYIIMVLTTDGFGVSHWRISGAPGSPQQDDRIIGPADGLFARPRVGSVAATISGEVRTWKFACPLRQGLNFIANPYPVVQSFADRMMSVAGGFTAASSSTLADKVNFWNGDTSTSTSYGVYFLSNASGIEQWKLAGPPDGLNHANDKLFEPGTGLFINSMAGNPTWVMPAPWTP